MMKLLKAIRCRFNFLYPLKTNTMHFFRTNPAYVAVAAALFLQIPILIAGTNALERKAMPGYISANAEEKKEMTKEELVLHMADSIYQELDLDQTGLRHEAFTLAFKGYQKLLDLGLVARKGLLSIADFSKPSTENRFFVIDMESGKMLFNTLVAHGRNSGLKYATAFSNKPSSFKSSLGFYVTMHSYYGDKGYALKLKGLERGINDNAYERAIVIHGSDYVNPRFAATQGYLGRSLGCPALPNRLTKPVINTIKDGSLLFIYHPNEDYLNKSEILNS